MPVDKKEIIDRYGMMKREREASIEAIAKDVSEFLVPYRGRYPGDDRKPDRMHKARGSNILDTTPGDALDVATNGMYSGLTPPSRVWHHTRFEEDGLNKWGVAKSYMDALERRRNSELRRSNFYSSMHSAFAESISFSNAMIYMRELDAGGFIFRCHTFGEYYWSRNSMGRVDTVYRPEWMTAKTIVEEFGDENCSRQVNDSIKNNRPFDTYEILHVVEPRNISQVSRKDSKGKKYQSVWIELSNDKKVLRESGFDDFPYACAAWLLVGSDNYGSGSPGMKKLPDIKQLQDMEESCTMAVHREVDPPIQAPSGMKGSPIRKGAGGITYYEGQGEGLKRLYEFNFDVAAGEAKSEAIRRRITKGFYNDLFLMITSLEASGQKQVTATQVREMKAQGLLQLGPFIERQEDELLDHIVVFVTNRMLARPWIYGLSEPPVEIMGQEYHVEYVGLLAQAQREVGVLGIDDTVQFVSMIVPLIPAIMDNFNWDEIARERSDLVGLPARLMVPEDQVAQTRAERARKAEEQQAAQEALAATEGAKNLGAAKMSAEDPNALTEMMRMLGDNA